MEMERIRQVYACFKSWDTKDDGFIAREQLSFVLRSLMGPEMSREHVDRLISDAAGPKAEMVPYSYFLDLMFRGGNYRRTKRISFRESSLQSTLNVWASSIFVNGAVPSKAALKEILYGDDSNSAEGADIVALHIAELCLKEDQFQDFRGLLRGCLSEPHEYIFNEDDPTLGIYGFPAQLTAVEGGRQEFTALYIAVKKCLACDYDGDGRFMLVETFPMSGVLTCGTKSCVNAHKYRNSESIMMQEIIVKSQVGYDRPVHILMLGATLSSDFNEQHRQVAQLKRILDMHHQRAEAFSAIFFGNANCRIVCSEDYKDHVVPKASRSTTKRKQNNGTIGKHTSLILREAGVRKLCEELADPVTRRNVFFRSSLHFTGRDCCGRLHRAPPQSLQMLRSMFNLSHDFCAASTAVLPIPTSFRCATDVLWTKIFGFRIRMPELVSESVLVNGIRALHLQSKEVDELARSYFPSTLPASKAHSRVLKKNLGDALYLQMGWLDGLGLYRDGSCPAELRSWSSVEKVFAYDHMPITGSVMLRPPGVPPLRVWVGAIKLDKLFPSKTALQEILYGTNGNSALDAHVIALTMTDLEVDKNSVHQIQNLMYNAMPESVRDQYIFNEQEAGLVLKSIPCKLLTIQTECPRYSALYICVHKAVAGKSSSMQVDIEDVFPSPPESICRSDMKNEEKPSFKGHIAQHVVLKCGTGDSKDSYFRLALVGLNFETEDQARARQVERLERYLQSCNQENTTFAAVVFGDFNNRLVCVDWLAPYVNWKGEGGVKEPVLSVAGARELCTQLAVPDGGKEILRNMDSRFYTGRDASGSEISVPAACQNLKRLFDILPDVDNRSADVFQDVQMPTYKRTPPSEVLSILAGFPLQILDLTTLHQLEQGITRLQDIFDNLNNLQPCVQHDLSRSLSPATGLPLEDTAQDLQDMYFDGYSEARAAVEVQDVNEFEDDCSGVNASRSACEPGPPMLSCGWPEVIGVYKHGVLTRSEILSWGSCCNVLGSLRQMPIRAKIQIHQLHRG